jgi:hypothetical protein
MWEVEIVERKHDGGGQVIRHNRRSFHTREAAIAFKIVADNHFCGAPAAWVNFREFVDWGTEPGKRV